MEAAGEAARMRAQAESLCYAGRRAIRGAQPPRPPLRAEDHEA